METTPYWIDTGTVPRFPKIDQDLSVDVVVIGAGIMGVTAAYLLKHAGRSVALLDRDRCVRIDTGHTTAHLTAVTDLSRQETARTFGQAAAKAVWEAGGAAIDQIVNLIRAENIACNFHWAPGYLHQSVDGEKARDRQWLESEFKAATDLGIEAEWMESVPFFDRPGIKFPHQAIFHPRKYLAALLEKIPNESSHVFEESEAGDILDNPTRVKVDGHVIRCDHVVMATHNPLVGQASVLGATLFQTKLSLYTSYAVGAKIPAGKISTASYWDTADPYNYLRVERKQGYDYAILGGEDHKTGQSNDTAAHYERIERRLKKILPDAEIDHRWSGQVIDTNDGLPFIGALSGNQFGATGFAGNGMTFGTLGAMMARDSIMQRKNPWSDLFDPGRKTLRGGTWTFLKENKDYPYYMLRDWLGGSEGKSLKTLKKGQGKILRLDGKKVAAYRDDHGTVSLCSPICTHLKCIVAWNDAECTWDCPCHGSRFKPTGEVMSGPAEAPLEKLPKLGVERS